MVDSSTICILVVPLSTCLRFADVPDKPYSSTYDEIGKVWAEDIIEMFVGCDVDLLVCMDLRVA